MPYINMNRGQSLRLGSCQHQRGISDIRTIMCTRQRAAMLVARASSTPNQKGSVSLQEVGWSKQASRKRQEPRERRFKVARVIRIRFQIDQRSTIHQGKRITLVHSPAPCALDRTVQHRKRLYHYQTSASTCRDWYSSWVCAGSASVLLATCAQLREAVCPLVTKITVTELDKSSEVDFSGLLHSRWSSIQSLTLDNREVSEQSMHQIISPGWPFMTSLAFNHCSFGLQTASFLAQAQWPLLQTLDLASTSLGFGGLKELVKGKWPDLQVLCLRSCSLKAEAMTCLSHAEWPELRHLCLDDNDLDLVEQVPDPEYGVAWQHDSGFAAMSELIECKWQKLEKLNLDNTNIAAKGCHVLSQAQWPNFRHLTMCNVGSYDLSELSKTDWPLLSGLDVSQCQGILAESIPDLIAANWPLLAHLDISGCSVGEEALALLAEANWPHMKSLYIQDNYSNKAWYGTVTPDVPRVVKMLTIADWPLIEDLDISGWPLNAEAAELLISCPWSHSRHLRYSCTYEDDSTFSQMFQSTWPCLGYKHADKVSEQMAHFVLSSSAVIAPMRHIYSDDEWWCIRNQ